MTPTQARLAAERKARLSRMEAASLAHFDRCYDEAQASLPKVVMPAPKLEPEPVCVSETIHQRHPLQSVRITRLVCNHFEVNPVDMFGPSRSPKFVMARSIAQYVLREQLKWSFPQIGKKFHRDHTSVLAAVERTRKMMAEKPEIAEVVQKVVEGLAA